MVLVLILTFFSFVCGSDDLTCFIYRRFINVTSTTGYNLTDVDVPLSINTRDLILNSKLNNCSYLRFDDNGTLLNFFVENECNSPATHAIIWLNVASLPVSGVTISMYYGCDDYDKLPTQGAEIDWSGRFFVGTNSSTCPSGWDDIDLESEERFVSLNQSFKGCVDEDEDFEFHYHTVNVTLGVSASFQAFTSNVGGNTDDYYVWYHDHRWSTPQDSGSPSPSINPPYYTLKGCESRYLGLKRGCILPLNSTDFSYGGIARFEKLDGKFLVFSDTSNNEGGYTDHIHSWTIATGIPETSVYVTSQWVTPFPPVEIGSLQHTHMDAEFDTNPHSNLPNGAQFPFVYVLENDTDSVPYLFFVNSLPPLGYHDAGIYDRFIEGGATIDWIATTADRSSESIDIASFVHDITDGAMTSGIYESDVNVFTKSLFYNHEHPLEVWSFENSFDGDYYDPNDLNKFQVMGAVRKDNKSAVVVKAEEGLFWCNGLESREDGVCDDSGTCNGENNCTCNDGYFGDECKNWWCGDYWNNDTYQVCSGHGNCTTYDRCICDMNWFGVDTSCNITFCNGVLGNQTGILRSVNGDSYLDWDENVCGSHGECVDFETCDCQNDTNGRYFGDYCGYWLCFGVNNTENVCAGKGVCVDIDTCACEIGFTEDNCSSFDCGGLSSTDEESCSGEDGTCVGSDMCLCDPQYYFLMSEVEGTNVTECLHCPDGYHRDYSGVNMGVETCEICPEGYTFSDLSPEEGCLPCPKGTYSNTDRDCLPCPRGTYNDVEGASGTSFCIPCPSGYFGNGEQLTSKLECTPCPEGTFNSKKNMTSLSDCRDCDDNELCPIGSSYVMTLSEEEIGRLLVYLDPSIDEAGEENKVPMEFKIIVMCVIIFLCSVVLCCTFGLDCYCSMTCFPCTFMKMKQEKEQKLSKKRVFPEDEDEIISEQELEDRELTEEDDNKQKIEEEEEGGEEVLQKEKEEVLQKEEEEEQSDLHYLEDENNVLVNHPILKFINNCCFLRIKECCNLRSLDLCYDMTHTIEEGSSLIKRQTKIGGCFSIVAICLALTFMIWSCSDFILSSKKKLISANFYKNSINSETGESNQINGTMQFLVDFYGDFGDLNCSSELTVEGFDIGDEFDVYCEEIDSTLGCRCSYTCEECTVVRSNLLVQFDFSHLFEFVRFIRYEVILPSFEDTYTYNLIGQYFESNGTIDSVAVDLTLYPRIFKAQSDWNLLLGLLALEELGMSEKRGIGAGILSERIDVVPNLAEENYPGIVPFQFVLQVSTILQQIDDYFPQTLLNFLAQLFSLIGASVSFVGLIYIRFEDGEEFIKRIICCCRKKEEEKEENKKTTERRRMEVVLENKVNEANKALKSQLAKMIQDFYEGKEDDEEKEEKTKMIKDFYEGMEEEEEKKKQEKEILVKVSSDEEDEVEEDGKKKEEEEVCKVVLFEKDEKEEEKKKEEEEDVFLDKEESHDDDSDPRSGNKSSDDQQMSESGSTDLSDVGKKEEELQEYLRSVEHEFSSEEDKESKVEDDVIIVDE